MGARSGDILAVITLAVLSALAPQATVSQHAKEQTRLSLPEAKADATEALRAGRNQEALFLANGLLLANRIDIGALLIKSRAERNLGQFAQAQSSARRAWTAAKGRERYFAALAMAQALSSDGKRGRAQLWLRRAAQIAPNEALEARARGDFRYVKSRNPWALRLSFDVENSSNINGAPKTNAFSFGGFKFVNPDNVPLDGLRYGVTADLQRFVPLTPTARLRFGLRAETSRVTLSDAARDKVPSARDFDFAYDDLQLSTGIDLRGTEGTHVSRATLSFARDWRAGKAFSDVQRLSFAHDRRLNGSLSGGIRLTAETEQVIERDNRDALSLSADAHLEYDFGTGRARLTLGIVDTESTSAAIAKRSERASLSYSFSQPILWALPSISINHQQTRYNDPLYGPEERADSKTQLSLNLVLHELDFYGFAPVVSLTKSDTRSNYELFENENTNFKLGLRSLF